MAKDIEKNQTASKDKAIKPRTKDSTAKSSKAKGMIDGWIVFFQEVLAEMKKVTWPSRKEVSSSTIALLSATVLISVYLGIVDFVLARGIQPALAGNAGIMTFATFAIFVFLLLWVYKSN